MIFDYILSQQTEIKLSDLKYVFISAAIYAVYRVIINETLLKPLSNFVTEKNRYKFVHRGFDCFHYIICSIIGIIAFSQRRYGHCPFYFLNCENYIQCTGVFMCTVLEKIYFFIFASYYISDVLWIKTTKDIPILIFHHSVTIGMIVLSVIVARPIIGMSIMLLHDIVDLFLYTGKITSYLEIKKLSNFSFITFAALFFYLRLFGCASIIYIICFKDKTEQPHHYWGYVIARTLFCFLYCCHLLWGIQIVKAILKIFKGDKIHDTRSDQADNKNVCKEKNQ